MISLGFFLLGFFSFFYIGLVVIDLITYFKNKDKE
jgi:hypothetical protein